MGEKCFGALALPAESKKHDLLRETKRAPTSWGHEFVGEFVSLLEGKQSDPNRKEKESTFTKQSENFQSQKAVGLFLGIITQGHIIHWNNS